MIGAGVRVAVGFDSSGVPAFSPPSVASLALWLDASAISGAADGDPVQNWNDLSGNGLLASQATLANRPLYRTSYNNGRPALVGDGVNDNLVIPYNGAANLFNRDALSIFVVASRSVAAYHEILSRNYTVWEMQWHAGNWLSFYTNATSQDAGNNTLPSDGAPRIAAVVYGSAGISGYVGTTLVFHSDTPPAIPASTNGLYIFSRFGGSEFLNGGISEILVYNSQLSGAARLQVCSYLKSKWGTP